MKKISFKCVDKSECLHACLQPGDHTGSYLKVSNIFGLLDRARNDLLELKDSGLDVETELGVIDDLEALIEDAS